MNWTKFNIGLSVITIVVMGFVVLNPAFAMANSGCADKHENVSRFNPTDLSDYQKCVFEWNGTTSGIVGDYVWFNGGGEYFYIHKNQIMGKTHAGIEKVVEGVVLRQLLEQASEDAVADGEAQIETLRVEIKVVEKTITVIETVIQEVVDQATIDALNATIATHVATIATKEASIAALEASIEAAEELATWVADDSRTMADLRDHASLVSYNTTNPLLDSGNGNGSHTSGNYIPFTGLNQTPVSADRVTALGSISLPNGATVSFRSGGIELHINQIGSNNNLQSYHYWALWGVGIGDVASMIYEAYDQGYNKGYADGYHDGYQDGFEDGVASVSS